MKRLLSIMILLCGIGFSQAASSAIWSWIDSLTECTVSATYCFDYTYTISDWDTNDTTANPCYGLSACTIFIGHRHDANGTSGPKIVRSWASSATAYKYLLTEETMGGLAAKFKEHYSLPKSGTTRHSGNAISTEECVGIFYAPGESLGNLTDVNSSKFSGYSTLPGSICGAAPAPSGTCDFVQDSITLDHGTLSKSELEGHQVSSTVNITCTSAKTLTLYIHAANDVELREDGSLYSELYMNDTILGTTGITLDVDSDAVVDVKSVLRTNGSVTAGEFSGSTVMLITIE